jgi:histone-binding protein RBBP4
LTGGSDNVVNIFDVRKLDAPLSSIPHAASVINVRWSPDDPNVFVTTDEAANLTMYRLDATTKKGEVVFQHLGHRTSVVDVQFNPFQPWTLASVSDDSADEARGGGGTLQIWRVSEFVYKSMADKDWAEEMEQAFIKSTTKVVGSEDESGDET